MKDMTHSKPDSAKPTGEPASAVRSPGQDPCGSKSLCPQQRAGSSGLRPRAETKREREQMPWLGRWGGWGRKGWKRGRDKQGDPFGDRTVFMVRWPKEPPGGSQSVHSSDEAG